MLTLSDGREFEVEDDTLATFAKSIGVVEPEALRLIECASLSAAKASLSHEGASVWFILNCVRDDVGAVDAKRAALLVWPESIALGRRRQAAADEMTEALEDLRAPLKRVLSSTRSKLDLAGITNEPNIRAALDALDRAAGAVAMAWCKSVFYGATKQRERERGRTQRAEDAEQLDWGLRQWIRAHVGRAPRPPEVVIAEILLEFTKPCEDEHEFTRRTNLARKQQPQAKARRRGEIEDHIDVDALTDAVLLGNTHFEELIRSSPLLSMAARVPEFTPKLDAVRDAVADARRGLDENLKRAKPLVLKPRRKGTR